MAASELSPLARIAVEAAYERATKRDDFFKIRLLFWLLSETTDRSGQKIPHSLDRAVPCVISTLVEAIGVRIADGKPNNDLIRGFVEPRVNGLPERLLESIVCDGDAIYDPDQEIFQITEVGRAHALDAQRLGSGYYDWTSGKLD